jgi:Flp pilus assembly protein TadG
MRNTIRAQHGQGLVEFAMLLPVLIILMFAIFDFGLAMNHRVVISNAAREAARYAATGQAPDNVKARAVQQSEGLIASADDVSVTYYDTNADGRLTSGDSVAVNINYAYKLVTILPLFFSDRTKAGPFEMNACTDMRLEQVPASAKAATSGAPCK